ncbi:hypothetical protein [Paracoccus tegillarcae]|uniref:Calcium-binding protein n=1 Tax=Paracoccus tegillarcae TaxID=1529068 RepID=A0A2K9EEA0_9RHOB|nr:hypothetical protein [Paracoccus tegillarcae]AUH33270.1 hypothetical protein CUV01_07605 [Paracoccus tegillarcae]
MNIIYGTNNNDIMFATDGSDWIDSLLGIDVIHGGGGKDVYTVAADGLQKVFQDFQDGSDLIDLRGAGINSFDELTLEVLGDDKVKVTNADGSLQVFVQAVDGEPLTVDATDFIYADTPVIEYSRCFDSVNVGSNEYAVHLGNGGNNWLNLKQLVRGADTAREGALVEMDDDALGNGTFTIKGVTQHFFDFSNVRGTNGQDTIHGDQQDNNLVGLGNADRIYGGDGDDRIFGNSGTDRLFGDDGDDIINGGTGYDLLRGGEGADTFVFVSYDNRTDVVFDYEDGTDMLDISQWGVTSVDDLEITQLSAGRLRIELPSEGLGFELRSEDGPLSPSDMDNGDFIFV